MRCLLLMLAACVAEVPVDQPGATIHPDVTQVTWSVSRHVWPTDSRAALSADLATIAELGARYVRTDLWWYAVEPSPGMFDANALDLYSWYVDEAGRHGLGVIAILSNAPAWAKQLYDTGERDAFAGAFAGYARRIGETIGDRVDTFQLWNEPNNITDFPDSDMDVQLFLAGRTGLELAHVAPLRTAINVLVDGHDGPFVHWEDDVRYYLDHGAAGAIDIIAIDHYPGTWSIGDWGGNILDRLFALGGERGKSVAIFETGFSTSHCTLPFNTEQAQADWIHDQLPRLRAKLAGRTTPFVLANWFKLDDRNSSDCFDPEDNFGVVRTDRSRKPAFDALREEITRL